VDQVYRELPFSITVKFMAPPGKRSHHFQIFCCSKVIKAISEKSRLPGAKLSDRM